MQLVGARGQQHLGQHGGADPLQMFPRQMDLGAKAVVGQDVPHGGALDTSKFRFNLNFIYRPIVTVYIFFSEVTLYPAEQV